MGNQFVMVNEGDDKNIDCEEVTVSGVVVQRQRMQIAGAADVAIAAVQATAVAGTEQGLVVRPVIVGTLIPKDYDAITLGYTGDNLTTVVYKTGGTSGSTVATLTLAYTGSVLNSIARSYPS